MPGRAKLPHVPLSCSIRYKAEVMLRIPLDGVDALQVLKDYGEEAYNAFRAKRLRCILHPEEERAIYVDPEGKAPESP